MRGAPHPPAPAGPRSASHRGGGKSESARLEFMARALAALEDLASRLDVRTIGLLAEPVSGSARRCWRPRAESSRAAKWRSCCGSPGKRSTSAGGRAGSSRSSWAATVGSIRRGRWSMVTPWRASRRRWRRCGNGRPGPRWPSSSRATPATAATARSRRCGEAASRRPFGRPGRSGSMVPPEPGPLPSPPGDLGERALPLRTIERSWFRFHAPGRATVHFGRKAENRFNAPGGEFGVLYLAADPAGAFIEVFGRVSGPRVVTPGQLARRNLAEVRPPRPLRLLNPIGAGLARIGADARLFAGEHEVARRWSLALHWHPQAPDGILYPARQ